MAWGKSSHDPFFSLNTVDNFSLIEALIASNM